MAISEYRKIQIEQRELDRKLDKIATQRSQENYTKGQLLRGSRTRITELSLKASSEIEKKYAEIYGENWRDNLSSEKVEQIEEMIEIEKRNAREEIEERTLTTKLGGRSLIKKRRY